jgi:hypothetical protein
VTDALPLKGTLLKKFQIEDSLCPFCRIDKEDWVHMIKNRPFAKAIWFY